MDENIFLKNVGRVAMPIGHSLVFHPFTTCRVLIQLGYEPDPPFRGHTLLSLLGLGQKALKLPSIFTYSRRIADKVGWSGLFLIGFPAKLCYTSLSQCVTEEVYSCIVKEDKTTNQTKKMLLDTDKPFAEYMGEVSIVAAARITGLIVSYPLEVIMTRQIAQILEGDGVVTSSIFTWITKIIRDEGIIGFYGGVSSKLFGELVSLTLATSLVYAIDNYLLKTTITDTKEYTPTFANMIVSSLVYKYNVISTVLAVSGSGLMIAIPFKGFSDAHSYLKKKRAVNRGSSLFIRYAPL